MISLVASDLKPSEQQSYLQHAIAPRPICFASTVDQSGNVNLSPFSFFNLFSVNPPICVFSPSRRVRDNTTKHTLDNLKEVPEVVINIVNYSMVQQTSLASTEYPKGVNEFVKSGLTELKSQMIRPPRVAEAPVQLECIVKEIIPLGTTPGSGNLVVAEVKLIHIHEEILDDSGKIDQAKIDLVARLGGDWYCRVTKESLFKVVKPLKSIGIGVDALPYAVRNSKVLTGNNLGQLGNVESLPDEMEIEEVRQDPFIKEILKNEGEVRELKLHTKAKELLDQGEVKKAWCLLLCPK